MKKRLTALLLVSAILALLPQVAFAAPSETFKDPYSELNFTITAEPRGINNGAVDVAPGTYDQTSYIIPAAVTYEGKTYDVTRIGEEAFSGCDKLKSIMIPGSVRTIASKAFLNCSALTDVDIPYSVERIEPNAFEGCVLLGELNYLPSPDEKVFGQYGLLTTRVVGPDSTKVTVFGENGLISDPSLKRIKNNGIEKYNVQVNVPYGYTLKGLYLLSANAPAPVYPYSISNEFTQRPLSVYEFETLGESGGGEPQCRLCL